ncbi:hypothetical protein RAB80_002671 [Fusarium oxysporum f. sp. vasinfectum]|uniref:Uncharacterized protein n=1 Tax=Fusarium oxysporum TaxID=5507 RepID=A0A2H3T4Z7_FUSOX|nr:hypothetical protein FOWG_08099 [Fusarium oxysporum f. sp. lycopersici MN25]KAK2680878.1 hypothetical protein RAB80_002671 [Fusarium oxysporum f. sp. vasinfectum]SCO78010.1 uncharacterized protein FRV6_02222 [Fusarium oxysporum]
MAPEYETTFTRTLPFTTHKIPQELVENEEEFYKALCDKFGAWTWDAPTDLKKDLQEKGVLKGDEHLVQAAS